MKTVEQISKESAWVQAQREGTYYTPPNTVGSPSDLQPRPPGALAVIEQELHGVLQKVEQAHGVLRKVEERVLGPQPECENAQGAKVYQPPLAAGGSLATVIELVSLLNERMVAIRARAFFLEERL